MILINLLPHREEKRQRRKIAFFAGLGAAAAAGLAIVGIWYLVVQQLTSAQQARNDFLNAEIKKLEVQIKDRRGKTASKKIHVTPRCAEPGEKETACRCLCRKGYVLGETCGEDAGVDSGS